MPYHYRLAPAAGLGYVRYAGLVDGSALLQSLSDVFADPGWSSTLDVIWDGSGIKQLVLVPGDLERMAAFKDRHRQVSEPGADLLIAVRDIDYVVARLYVLVTRILHVRVFAFHSLDEALRHLGLAALPPELAAVQDEA